ncbi:MAG: translation elongation factor-like protein [Nitrospirae bacterium]|nr:translation elongation factor-like protein [Candidatus Troglogloeales bacterium]
MHYYAQIGVAVVRLDQNALRVGEQIHIKGHTTDFTQIVESMEVDHQPVVQAIVGDLFGLKVAQHVREGDVVYKV